MGTTSLTREQLNEAISDFANKIMDALGAAVTDEETTEPEPTGTRFKAIDIDGEERVVDATDITCGTLVADGPFEYFRCTVGGYGNSYPWMRYNGRQLTHWGFAEEMRNLDMLPRIVHEG